MPPTATAPGSRRPCEDGLAAFGRAGEGDGARASGRDLLEPFGVAANRRFFVVDEGGRRYGQIRNGTLVQIEPEYDETSGA